MGTHTELKDTIKKNEITRKHTFTHSNKLEQNIQTHHTQKYTLRRVCKYTDCLPDSHSHTNINSYTHTQSPGFQLVLAVFTCRHHLWSGVRH